MICGGVEIVNVYSVFYSIDVYFMDKFVYGKQVVLFEKWVIFNRDLILWFELGGQDIQVGVLIYVDECGGFFSMFIIFLELFVLVEIVFCEIVFVMDIFGLMNGLFLDVFKKFMYVVLKVLCLDDVFCVV